MRLRKNKLFFVPLVGAWVQAMTACDTPQEPLSSFSISDSAGIRIATSTGPAWPTDRAWRLSAEPVYVVGANAADSTDQLWNVTGIVRLSDGQLVVLNGGTKQLRFYDAQGRHRFDRGGAGDGPGELRAAQRLTRTRGDSLLVLDRTTIERYDRDGRHVGSRVLPDNLGMPMETAFVVPTDLLSNGNALVMQNFRAEGPPPAGELYRPRMGVGVFVSSADSTVHMQDARGVQQAYLDVGAFPRPYVPPFARHTSVVSGGTRPLAVVADNAHAEFRVYAADGALEQIVRWTPTVRQVEAAWVEAWKAEQREADWTRGQLPDLERAWAVLPTPETLPAFDAIAVAVSGEFWVLAPSTGAGVEATFNVFAADGRWLGSVNVAPGFEHNILRRPYIDDEYFIGVWTDELDREQVRAYRMVRPS